MNQYTIPSLVFRSFFTTAKKMESYKKTSDVDMFTFTERKLEVDLELY